MNRRCHFPVNRGEHHGQPGESGQSTVEFMLMIVVILFVMFTFLSFTFLGTQAFLTRYTSFAGARGYLAYSNGFGDDWQDAARWASRLIPNRAGTVRIDTVDDGVRVRIKVRELFPSMGLYGRGGVMELEATTRLGEEPEMRGDNVL